MRSRSCPARRGARRLSRDPDLGNSGRPDLAFALVSVEGGDKGIEHRSQISHGTHSRRECDALRNPTCRRQEPLRLDRLDRANHGPGVGGQPAKRGLAAKAQRSRQRPRRPLRPADYDDGSQPHCKLVTFGLGPSDYGSVRPPPRQRRSIGRRSPGRKVDARLAKTFASGSNISSYTAT